MPSVVPYCSQMSTKAHDRTKLEFCLFHCMKNKAKKDTKIKLDQFSLDKVSLFSNNELMFLRGPRSRKNSLELIELSSINKVSFV